MVSAPVDPVEPGHLEEEATGPDVCGAGWPRCWPPWPWPRGHRRHGSARSLGGKRCTQLAGPGAGLRWLGGLLPLQKMSQHCFFPFTHPRSTSISESPLKALLFHNVTRNLVYKVFFK